MANERRKRFPWIIYLMILALILIFTLAPIGSVAVAGWLATTHGCRVDEGSVHPCMINGVDRGPLLYAMGVMGWLMLITLPAGGLALVLLLVILIVHRSHWRKRPSQVGNPADEKPA